MSRLADIREQDVTGKAAEIFKRSKSGMGKVPNAYLTIGVIHWQHCSRRWRITRC